MFDDALTVARVDGLKAMGAVHVAIARHHGCQRFVTTDPHFNALQTLEPVWIALPAD